MIGRRLRLAFILSAFGLVTLLPNPAGAGDLKWDEGRWRLELSGFAGVHQGSRSREGDWNINGAAEYEAPLWNRATLGIRLQPLFFYHDDAKNNDVFGIGAGPSIRLYQKAHERRGFFAEASVTALVHTRKISGNSSKLNFSSEFGVGYKFENNWHVAVKYRHISNASIGSRNSGANALGVGVGFTF